MKNREQFVLKAFLSHCSDKKKEALEKFLPERELDLLKKIPSIDKPDQIEEGSLIDIVHWSWFLEILKNHSETEQKLLLQALPPYAAKNLAKSLTLTSTQETLHNVTKKYLQSFLIGSLIGPHNRLLPKEFLPPSPLKPLLNLSKNKLTELIDFLALHDLAYDLRQIVETKILKKIYSLLSEEERQFLKKLYEPKRELFPFENGTRPLGWLRRDAKSASSQKRTCKIRRCPFR